MPQIPTNMYRVQVRLPNSVIMEGEFGKNVSGRECLESFCQRLGVYETDFFGLKCWKRGSTHWLFLRRALFDQIPKVNARILLCVKFFVRPSELQQITTKRMYYHEMKGKLRSGEVSLQESDVAKAGACMCLLENLSTEVKSGRNGVLSKLLPERYRNSEIIWEINQQLVALEQCTHSEAIHSFLDLMSGTGVYGVYSFVAQTEKDRDVLLTLGNGDVSLCDMNTHVILSRIQIRDINEVSYTENKVIITSKIENTKGARVSMYARVSNRHQSRDIFRILTEHHVYFYQHRVPEGILCHRHRPSRLGLGRGSYFMFDVIRTREESYAFHWAQLHSVVAGGDNAMEDSIVSSHGVRRDSGEFDISELRESTRVQMNDSSLDSTLDLDRSRVSATQVGLTTSRSKRRCQREEHCKICYTNRVKTVFCPCGHSVCCIACSKRVRSCPICRKGIAHRQTVFNS